MAIGKATCPTCGSLFQVDSSMVGQYVRCPWCDEEIYMEGVDAPKEVPVGILHPRPAPTAEATAEEPPVNLPPSSPEPLDEYVAEDEEPSHDESEDAAKFMSPGLYALFALVALLCAFLGYRTAVKRHRQRSAVPRESVEQATVQPFPHDGYAAVDDTPFDEEPNDGEGEVAVPPATDAETVVDEDTSVGVAETVSEDAELEEADPFESVVAEAEEEGQNGDGGGSDDEAFGPFELDAASLSGAYRESGISTYSCRLALKDFEKAVATANAAAETNRASMVRIVVKYLKSGMSTAQASGDLDKVIAFKTALETADAGIDGDLEEIVKLRASRDAQKAKIDNALLAAGITAAKGLLGALEWQKREMTRKNEIDEAKKIASFQKQIEEWMTKTKDAVSAPSAAASGGRVSPRPAATEESRPFARGFSTQTLTGTQTETSVTLTRSPQPHVVKEQYLVPKGKELIVEAGVTLVFEEGASLYCEGTLYMNGTERAPIVCKGHMGKVGYWNGITVKAKESTLEFVRITDAKTGITTVNSPTVRNCIFTKNETGVKLGSDQRGQTFINCLISGNAKNGVNADFRNTVLFERCTIEDNGEWGILSGYHYGTVNLESTTITRNRKGGIHLRRGGSHANAKNCIIMDNDGYDVENACDDDTSWNLRQNYWGPSATRLLQQRGDGVNLPNIKDGRDSGRGNIVDVAEFLTEPPRNCGATVKL